MKNINSLTIQQDAIEQADAALNNACLPTYTALRALIERLGYPDDGELLTLADYREIAQKTLTFDKNSIKCM